MITAADTMRERVVLASILQDPGAELSASLTRVLDFAEVFDSPELGSIAAAIRTARSNGTPADLPSIGQHLKADTVGAFMQLANETGSALPLELAACEAEALLAVIQSRRAIQVLGEAWEAAKGDPSNAPAIAVHCRAALAQLDGEAPPTAEAVPIGDLQRQQAGDPAELILSRYLCRLCALLLCGPTGIGKSSLLIQFLLLFGIGRMAFGLRPSRPHLRLY
jgi:hypothetical protein